VIRREGERLIVEGPVTLDTVPDLAVEIEPHLAAGATLVDFGGVTDIDSSAVALVLEWRRRAEHHSIALRLANTPDALQNLAKLYGVLELLPLQR
jgi:phospholipid transport system transporter-binding protein